MFLYQIIIFTLSPLILGHIVWLSITNKQSRYLWQRLGFQYSGLPKNCLWFHCASVGEVNTLLPLLKNIHKKNSALKVIVTSNTITGGKIVEQQKLDYLYHCYLPFDWSPTVKRFVSATRPVSLNVMETEIWPNLFAVCSSKQIPIHIINARLSKKTTSANRWIRLLIKNSLGKVTKIYSRSEENSEAFRQLGAAENIIQTIGNLKLTTMIREEETSATPSFNRDYVLLASTHSDEELQIYKIWKKMHRDELLIIVPRHPERGPSLGKQLACKEIAFRSRGDEITAQTEVFILDTIGELKNYFNSAKVVIMGGSFVPIGGHNILEPAAYNKAIITGPHMENFEEELDLMLHVDAIIQVGSFVELEQQLKKLLDDDNYSVNIQINTSKLSKDTKIILDNYTDLITASITQAIDSYSSSLP